MTDRATATLVNWYGSKAMAYTMKEGQGSLFANDKKTTDKHPNATGSALIDGVEYRVSAWTKTGDRGKWQSLAFTRKDEKPKAALTQKAYDEDDSDLPF